MDLLSWILEYPSWREKCHCLSSSGKSMRLFPDSMVSQPGWSRNLPPHSQMEPSEGWDCCWIPPADPGSETFPGCFFQCQQFFPIVNSIVFGRNSIGIPTLRNTAPAVSAFKGNLGMLALLPRAGNGTEVVQDPPGHL